MSQPTNLASLLWGQCFCNLPTKSKFCCDDTVILQGYFIVESPQVLLILTVRSLDNLVVIKTRIVASQKLDISDFCGIKYNDDASNSYQFVESINLESNSTTAGHYVAYLECTTGFIEIKDSNIQHYSDNGKRRLTLFPAGIIVRDFHQRKSSACREQDLSLRTMWVQADSIVESNQFMRTTHTLFYVSTSCLESENEVS